MVSANFVFAISFLFIGIVIVVVGLLVVWLVTDSVYATILVFLGLFCIILSIIFVAGIKPKKPTKKPSKPKKSSPDSETNQTPK